MTKNVAFIVNHFSERGTEVSTFNFAFYNKKILGNKSIIIAFNKDVTEGKESFINTSKSNFEAEFRILEIDKIEEMKDIIKKENITHTYVQSHGFHRDVYKFNKKEIWRGCQTIYHYVFGPMARQDSDIRCVIGEDLNIRFYKKIPVLPHIINKHTLVGDLRKELNINQRKIVIGRHGGLDTFDIEFVKKVIKQILSHREDIIFLFLNTNKFIEHTRVIHLPKTVSSAYKSRFINTCNCMLHARKDGETFGLAVAEFSAANKPIITYGKSKDNEHLRILNDKAIIYNNEKELYKILSNIENNLNKNKDFNCYENFRPSIVINKFDKICLQKKEKKLFPIEEFLLDLPWEFIIFLKIILKIMKTILLKLMPKKSKLFLKKLFKNSKVFKLLK